MYYLRTSEQEIPDIARCVQNANLNFILNGVPKLSKQLIKLDKVPMATQCHYFEAKNGLMSDKVYIPCANCTFVHYINNLFASVSEPAIVSSLELCQQTKQY